MAKTGTIRAGRAFVELFADDSRLMRGLRMTSAKLKIWGETASKIGGALAVGGASVGAMATAIAAPLALASKNFISYGDEIAKAATRTGMAAEEISALGYAAAQSGGDLATLVTGVRKMHQVIADAAAGSDSARKTLADLGLTVAELGKLTPDEQFRLIADRLGAIENPALRTAAAMDIFGKAGQALLPMFAGGAAGIKALEARAKALGLVMSDKDAKAAEALGDLFSDLWLTMKAVTVTIGAQLAPTLKRIADVLINVVVATRQWVEQNGALVFFAGLAVAATGALAAGLLALSLVAKATGLVFSLLSVAINVATASIVGMKAAVLLLAANPLTALLAAIVAIGVGAAFYFGYVGKVVDWLGGKFATLKGDALAAWKGIGDAMAAGDIALAAKVLWLTLKMEWTKGIGFLKDAWARFWAGLVGVGTQAITAVQSAAELGFNGILVAMIETRAGMIRVWSTLGTDLMNAWDHAIAFVEKRLFDVFAVAFSGSKGAASAIASMLGVSSLASEMGKLIGGGKSFDPKEAAALIDQRLGSATQSRMESSARNAEAAEKERLRAREAAAKSHAERMAKIGEGLNLTEANTAADRQKAIDKAQAEIDAARKEWQQALKDAENAKDKMPTGGPGKPGMPTLPSIPDATEAMRQTVTARGSFFAADLSRFGAGGATDRLQAAAEKTAKNTRDLVEMARRNRLLFES